MQAARETTSQTTENGLPKTNPTSLLDQVEAEDTEDDSDE